MPAVDRDSVIAALPDYTVGRELGMGGYGRVLAGHHHPLNRDVAIKILSLRAAHGESTTEDFRTEGRLLSRLDHPHIAQVYDFVSRGDVRLLVMELLSGGSLTRQHLSGPDACAVGLAVADALVQAHGLGVLHRDIKPDNILFTTAGQPKLTDFGIARMFDDPATVARGVIGTPRYMAPEQIREAELGPATDLYALGVTLYELMTGGPLFPPELSVPELLRHHCEVPAPVPVAVPEPIGRVVLRALAKDPAARPPSARVFAADLAAAARVVYGPGWLHRAGVVVRVIEDAGDPPTATAAGPATTVAAGVTADAELTRRVGTPMPMPLAAYGPGGSAAVPWYGAESGDGGGLGPTGVLVSPPQPGGAGPDGSESDGSESDGSESDGSAGEVSRAGTPTRVRRRWRRPAAAATGVLALVAATSLYLTWGGSSSSVSRPTVSGLLPTPRSPQVTGDPGARILPVAGTGAKGSPVDGALALRTSLGDPFGLTADAFGNLYFADFGSSRVMRINAAGVITTVAGTGVAGFSGDGGPAVAAQLNQPAGIALDNRGDLYIADTFNHRIRRVDPRGIITTVAGIKDHFIVGDPVGYSGAGAGDGGPAIAAPLSYPTAVATDDAGDLFIADQGENRIRKVDAHGIISTFAGSSGRGSFGDGGPATDALLDLPFGVAADAAGDVYIADTDNSRIRRVDAHGVITTVAGNRLRGFAGDGGPAVKASLQDPRGIAVDAAGNLYITDRGNSRIRKVDTRGIITTLAGSGRSGSAGDGGPAGNAELGRPDGAVGVDHEGNVFFSDRATRRVRVVVPSHPLPSTPASTRG
ncbi:protein kinase domain-containing protein [Frankia gtarii]|uniref:NHL domain-containing protein n=1 Tax=Frankia gtarii TaxID=2950102 RepID=UPI0021BEBD6C|nr:protein kinase [Frankia gtarii]